MNKIAKKILIPIMICLVLAVSGVALLIGLNSPKDDEKMSRAEAALLINKVCVDLGIIEEDNQTTTTNYATAVTDEETPDWVKDGEIDKELIGGNSYAQVLMMSKFMVEGVGNENQITQSTRNADEENHISQLTMYGFYRLTKNGVILCFCENWQTNKRLEYIEITRSSDNDWELKDFAGNAYHCVRCKNDKIIYSDYLVLKYKDSEKTNDTNNLFNVSIDDIDFSTTTQQFEYDTSYISYDVETLTKTELKGEENKTLLMEKANNILSENPFVNMPDLSESYPEANWHQQLIDWIFNK